MAHFSKKNYQRLSNPRSELQFIFQRFDEWDRWRAKIIPSHSCDTPTYYNSSHGQSKMKERISVGRKKKVEKVE